MKNYGLLEEYDIASEEKPVVTTMTEEFFKALSTEQIEKIISRDIASEIIYIITPDQQKIRAHEFFKKSFVN